jgi:hypothetical protein
MKNEAEFQSRVSRAQHGQNCSPGTASSGGLGGESTCSTSHKYSLFNVILVDLVFCLELPNILSYLGV